MVQRTGKVETETKYNLNKACEVRKLPRKQKKKRGRERSCEGLLGPGIGKKLELLNK